MKRKELFGICFVLLAGILALAAIILSEKRTAGSIDGHHDHGGHGHDHGHGHEGHEHGDGLHGGKVLREGALALELLIHDEGPVPHLRIYCSENGKPIDPREVTACVELTRLGDRVTRFDLVPDKDFLVSREEVEEPHSFEVKVTAQYRGESFEWEYWQIRDRLDLTPQMISKMGIKIDQAGPGAIKSVLRLPGEVVFNADRVCHIVPRASGVTLEARKELGDLVEKGEIIALIDSRELAEVRSKYLVAFEREKLARYNFERSQGLWDKHTIPEKEFLTAQKTYLEEKIELVSSARKLMAMGETEREIESLPDEPMDTLTRYAIKAPFDGIVVRKHLAPGEWVKEDAEIYMIADLSTVWVEITVYAEDINLVRVGQKATIQCESTGMETSGVVSYVGPVVGEESRTAKARVVIPNLEGTWKPGLFVRVELVDREISAPLVVRPDALQSYGDKTVVFVKYGDEFEARPVQLGLKDGELVEVIKGLAAGESYVCANSFILKAELGKQGISHQH